MPRGIYKHTKGSKNHNWKGGKPKCVDCGKALGSYASKRCQKCVRIGKLNFRWKGGRQINADGYVLILAKDHPFSECRGYIFEHRIVMEKHLGRYVRPEEVVHHINGIKTDNRIENLGLFANIGEHLTHHKKIRRIENGL